MSTPRVLLIGGHGKISQLLTPRLLSRSWPVTSLIRSPAQRETIIALGASKPGKLDVLVRSLEEVKTQAQAQSIITEANPSHIVWSAGAGGRGGAERTLAIDRDACIAFIKAAAATDSVKTFVLVSYVGSRRRKAPWWSDGDWDATMQTNEGVLRNYYQAKVAADECLTAGGRKQGFAGVCLRPGSLSDEPAGEKVNLGKTRARGKVSRGDVARVIEQLLVEEMRSCWIDLLEGEETVEEAVRRVVRDGVDCVEGEDAEGMVKQWS